MSAQLNSQVQVEADDDEPMVLEGAPRAAQSASTVSDHELEDSEEDDDEAEGEKPEAGEQRPDVMAGEAEEPEAEEDEGEEEDEAPTLTAAQLDAAVMQEKVRKLNLLTAENDAKAAQLAQAQAQAVPNRPTHLFPKGVRPRLFKAAMKATARDLGVHDVSVDEDTRLTTCMQAHNATKYDPTDHRAVVQYKTDWHVAIDRIFCEAKYKFGEKLVFQLLLHSGLPPILTGGKGGIPAANLARHLEWFPKLLAPPPPYLVEHRPEYKYFGSWHAEEKDGVLLCFQTQKSRSALEEWCVARRSSLCTARGCPRPFAR